MLWQREHITQPLQFTEKGLTGMAFQILDVAAFDVFDKDHMKIAEEVRLVLNSFPFFDPIL